MQSTCWMRKQMANESCDMQDCPGIKAYGPRYRNLGYTHTLGWNAKERGEVAHEEVLVKEVLR